MAHLSSKNVLLAAAAILCMTTMPPCKAQDAVQIVARAALCFDNHTVINSCLHQMGISTNGGGGAAAGLLSGRIPTSPNASAVFCGTPCFGHMMLMTECVDGILSNFRGYNSGLMQGVRAVFQMSCGAGNGAAAAAGGVAGDPPPHPHSDGGAVKSSAAASGKVARNAPGGAAASAANGAAAGGARVGNLLWVAILAAAQCISAYNCC
ncbi:hypothetical protein ACP4OV_005152 [Aristida adscensionis]